MNAADSLASRLVGRAVNRALQGEDALRARLAQHAGEVFELRAGPARASFAISAEGRLATPEPGATAQLTLDIAPHDVPRVMHDPASFSRLVRAEGDAALAATLGELAVTGPWFIERMFATAFGAVAGQRLADLGRALLGWPALAMDRMTGHVGSYVRDESDFGVAREEVASFTADVDALATRVGALAARVDALALRDDASAGH